MDSTVSANVSPQWPTPPGADRPGDTTPRLAALQSVREWRAQQALRLRAVGVFLVTGVILGCCALLFGTAQARVQIDFDPMRPALPSTPAEPAASGVAGGEARTSAPTTPTLRVTRTPGGANGPSSALVDDTWVRRGDVVAGYRVTALRTESVDLVSLADATQRLTLRLNPVAVERKGALASPPASPAAVSPSALEKRP
jgi:hypothetical protein